MTLKCFTCKGTNAVHFLDYRNIDTQVNWSGVYCNKCFIKKLRGMATAWSKRK